MPTENKPYWEIRNKTETSADLYLYSDISALGEQYGCTNAKDVQKAINALGKISRLNVYINSPGGNVFEGQAIRSVLNRLSAEKHVYIDGLCASIATVIAFGIGAKVHMGSASLVMIHKAWSYCEGNSEDFEKAAEDLKKCDSTLLDVYRNRTGGVLTDEEITEMMSEETWLTADECLNKGFIDDIVQTSTAKACLSGEYLKKYKNIPEGVTGISGGDTDKGIEMSAETAALINRVDSVLNDYNRRMEEMKYARY